jgi:hypothetical protein
VIVGDSVPGVIDRSDGPRQLMLLFIVLPGCRRPAGRRCQPRAAIAVCFGESMRGSLTVVLVVAACVPAPRAGRDDLATAPCAEGAGPTERWDEWSRWSGAGDGGMSIPEAGPVADAEVAVDAVADAEPGPRVLGAAEVAGGGALVVEAGDGGYGFVLDATGSATLSVEPVARLDGPAPAAVYLGPGCRTAAAGRAELLGRWTGEVRRCETEARATAVLDRLPGRSECPAETARPGGYTLSVWPCGSYTVPLGVVRFEVEAPSGDAGPGADTGP